MSTMTVTPGRVASRDLRQALAAAAGAKAPVVHIAPGCLTFHTWEVAARLPYPAREWEGDSLPVNRGLLTRIVRSFREDILVERLEDGLQLSSGPLQVSVPTAPDPNPERLSFDGEHLLTMNAQALARVLMRAEPFAGRDKSRPVLQSIALDFQAGKVVATDSYRLAAFDAPELTAAGQAQMLAISAPGLAPVSRALAQHSGDVTVKLADGARRSVIFEIGEQRWSVAAVDGKYPTWQQLIPDGGIAEFEVSAEAVAEVASLVTDAGRPGEPLILRVRSGALSVSTGHVRSESFDGVRVTRDIKAEGSISEELEIGVNPSFLRDAAQAIAPDPIAVSITSPLKPLLARAPGATHLLMPIRLV